MVHSTIRFLLVFTVYVYFSFVLSRLSATVFSLVYAGLFQELAVSQKEGDTLRGDLLANQKALSDLNVYADSLRSR